MDEIKYYIFSETENKLVECTESEYNTFNENLEYMTYVKQIYCGDITIDKVPEDKRVKVNELLESYIAEHGIYEDQPITGVELISMTEEVI